MGRQFRQSFQTINNAYGMLKKE